MKKIQCRAWLLALAFAVLWAGAALAAPVTVTGQGSSERSALHNAMRQAIEQEIGVLVDSRTYINNYQVINDNIYAQSTGYIESYNILRSGFSNGIWTVEASIEVRREALRADLMSKLQKQALIGANMQNPRIGVLVVDAEGNEYAGLENSIISGLQEQGFTRLIDLNQIEASVRKRLAAANAMGDTSLRNMLTNQFHVDYMVSAQVTTAGERNAWADVLAQQIPPGEPLGGILRQGLAYQKVQANIDVRMVNVNTGEITYAGSFSGKSRTYGAHAESEALAIASRDIVQAISNAALQKAANPEQHVSIIVTNGALGNMSATYQRIAALPGVNHVFMRSASQGTIQADVDFDGTAYDLAAELEREGIPIQEMNSEYIKI